MAGCSKLVDLLVVCALLEVVRGQGRIGFERPCGVDNFSCPRIGNLSEIPLRCFRRQELCNGLPFCEGGTDEGLNIVSLECKMTTITIFIYISFSLCVCAGIPGRPEDSVFRCEPDNPVPMSALCNGVNDCGLGNDETTALCESQHPLTLSVLLLPLSLPGLSSLSFSLQTSACCHIMGAVPTPETVLRQSLTSTAETVSLGSPPTPLTPAQLPIVMVGKHTILYQQLKLCGFSTTYCNVLWSIVRTYSNHCFSLFSPDINECAFRYYWYRWYRWRRYTICGPRGRCINTDGSFTCLCVHGYIWNGHRCIRKSFSAPCFN